MHRRQSLSCILSLPLLLSEDSGSALKGGVKVCERQLVNEALVFVTELALNLGCEGATPVHRSFHRRFLDRIKAVKLIRHSVLPDVRRAQLRFHGSQPLYEEPPRSRPISCYQLFFVNHGQTAFF